MAFLKISGKPKMEHYPVLVSTAFTNLQPVRFNGSGFLTPATASGVDYIGVIMKTIASTDADYATARKVAVSTIGEDDVYEVDVLTGTLTTAMVGNRYDIDSTGLGIDVTATSHKQLIVVGFKSATVALCKFTSLVTNEIAT